MLPPLQILIKTTIHLIYGNKKLNLSFVATIFNACPGLSLEESNTIRSTLIEVPEDDIEDTREERTFRMWINSLNIENVYVNNLFTDLEDGEVLLKVIDFVRPGSVNWKK